MYACSTIGNEASIPVNVTVISSGFPSSSVSWIIQVSVPVSPASGVYWISAPSVHDHFVSPHITPLNETVVLPQSPSVALERDFHVALFTV